jgi:hypothetical protein
MKPILTLMLSVGCVFAADIKPLPNQAGNDNIELVGTLIMDRQDIQQAIGGDLGAGYIVVRIKCTPKNDESLRIGLDDFTLISRKDGERSPAFSPTQIAGAGALVVKPAAKQPGGDGTRTNGPIWGGVSIGGARGPAAGNGSGNNKPGAVDAKIDDSIPENPILPLLKEKVLPDTETKVGVEGLLYFSMESAKLKPKDLSLIYKGTGGRLVMEFK